jgi:hypothetical protein
MNGHSDVEAKDRILAGLAYLMPILSVMTLSPLVFDILPFLRTLYMLLMPLINIYSSGMVSFGIFFLLYILVLKKPQVSRFIRFNVLQAILLGILLSLAGLVIGNMLTVIIGATVSLIVLKVVLLAVGVAAAWGVVCCGLGKYPEVPELSKNTHFMVDRL